MTPREKINARAEFVKAMRAKVPRPTFEQIALMPRGIKLGLTAAAASGIAHRSGIAKKHVHKEFKWTPEDLELLRRLAPICGNAEIAQRLGRGCTYAAVARKKNALRLTGSGRNYRGFNGSIGWTSRPYKRSPGQLTQRQAPRLFDRVPDVRYEKPTNEEMLAISAAAIIAASRASLPVKKAPPPQKPRVPHDMRCRAGQDIEEARCENPRHGNSMFCVDCQGRHMRVTGYTSYALNP